MSTSASHRAVRRASAPDAPSTRPSPTGCDDGCDERCDEATEPVPDLPAHRSVFKALRTADADLVVIDADGSRALAALITPALSLQRVKQMNLDFVVDVLEGLGVEHFLVDNGSRWGFTVAVSETDRDRILRALQEAGRHTAVYVSSPSRPLRRGPLIGAAPLDGWLARALTLELYQIFVMPGQEHVRFARKHACHLEFWSDSDVGPDALRSHRINRVAHRLSGDPREPAVVEVSGRSYRTASAFTTRRILDVDFPVDVVYTWVDGADLAWRERKDRCLTAERGDQRHVTATSEGRYLDREELRWSLRSLEMYADWVRHVYLVTDGQLPSWLDTTNPRLRLVRHEDFFARPEWLPTFNSHAIEAQLHRIEGLSEHYVYLNDDVFLTRPTAPERFFLGNGLACFFPTPTKVDLGPVRDDDTPVVTAAKNNRALIERDFGRRLTEKLKHAPHPQLRSVLYEMEQRYAEEFARTASSRFRHPTDISPASALHHYYAFLTARAAPAHAECAYADISDPGMLDQLAGLMEAGPVEFLCLNDEGGLLSPDQATAMGSAVTGLLEELFPFTSSFEKPTETPSRG